MTDPQPQPFTHDLARVQATPVWDTLVQAFARFVAIPPHSRVLDVGCGTGSLARHLARDGQTVTGIDSAPLMIDRAQYLATEIPGATFEIGDVQKLRFPAETFDAALATNVIFLLPDPLAGLREMARVVHAGGWVAMLNPSPKMTVAAVEAKADEQNLDGMARVSLLHWASAAVANRRFSLDEARSLFDAAGLSGFEAIEIVGPGLALLAKGVKK